MIIFQIYNRLGILVWNIQVVKEIPAHCRIEMAFQQDSTIRFIDRNEGDTCATNPYQL